MVYLFTSVYSIRNIKKLSALRKLSGMDSNLSFLFLKKKLFTVLLMVLSNLVYRPDVTLYLGHFISKTNKEYCLKFGQIALVLAKYRASDNKGVQEGLSPPPPTFSSERKFIMLCCGKSSQQVGPKVKGKVLGLHRNHPWLDYN